MASGEGVVRGGRRELGPPSSLEKKRLKYASKPSSLLSAPLEGIEKANGGYVPLTCSDTMIITTPLLVERSPL